MGGGTQEAVWTRDGVEVLISLPGCSFQRLRGLGAAGPMLRPPAPPTPGSPGKFRDPALALSERTAPAPPTPARRSLPQSPQLTAGSQVTSRLAPLPRLRGEQRPLLASAELGRLHPVASAQKLVAAGPHLRGGVWLPQVLEGPSPCTSWFGAVPCVSHSGHHRVS